MPDRAEFVISWTAKATGERMQCEASRVEFPGNGKLVIYPVDSRWKFALDFFEFDQLQIEKIPKVRATSPTEDELLSPGWAPELPVPYEGCAACEEFLRAAVDAARRQATADKRIMLARERGESLAALGAGAREASLWSSNARAAYERHRKAHRATKSGFLA